MTEHSGNLKRFGRRVRIVRSWKGMAMGACLASVAASVWAGLDWANVAYTNGRDLGLLIAAGTIAGAVAGYLLRISPKALADSIDRRAELEDRLSTSIERSDRHEGFDEALHADAQSRLDGLKPAKLYPFKVGRWQGAACLLALLASGIFLLGNTPLLLSDQQKQDRKEMRQAGQDVEHVLKPVEEHADTPEQAAEDKKLEEAMRKLSQDLERARISKTDAMQKTNELQKQAQNLVKERATTTLQTLDKAQTAFDQAKKMEQDEMAKAGLQNVDPNAAKMSDEERQSKENDLQKQSQANQSEMSQLQSALQQAAPNSQLHAQLSKELQDLMKKQSELNKELEQLKLSQKVQDMLKRMMENPLYKKLLEKAAALEKAAEMQQKLQDAMKDAQQNGEQTKLSHEDIEKMQKQLEELADQLKDDQAMSDYLQKMIDALKAGCGT